MKEIDKPSYYKKFATVSVQCSVWSSAAKCYKCGVNTQEFTVFLGDEQRMSTMWASCCAECLPAVIREANDKGIETAESQITRAENRLYQESLEYVRKTKLNNIINK